MSVGLPKGVKITYLPTGQSATCWSERSQYHNRMKAQKALESEVRRTRGLTAK